jgi:hypothetical protein
VGRSFIPVCRVERVSAIELVNEETVAARKVFGLLTDTIGEVDRLLINLQFLEGKGHRERNERE